MRKRQLSALTCSIGIAALVVVYLTASHQSRAVADDPDPVEPEPVTEEAEPNPTIEPSSPPHDPFTLHPADPGAQRWEDLSPSAQSGIEQAMEWAEISNGAPVHAAFSQSAQEAAAAADIERLERLTGLEGVETLGVVP